MKHRIKHKKGNNNKNRSHILNNMLFLKNGNKMKEEI